MALNCRPGDLAIVVRSKAGNLGKLARCIRVAAEEELGIWFSNASGAVWVVDQPMAVFRPWTESHQEIYLAPDECLRPIRDPGEDAKDETLEWLPVPEKVTA